MTGNYYTFDQYVTVLGCVDQHQFCNPNALGQDRACTKLASGAEVGFATPNLRANQVQLLTAGRLGIRLFSLTTNGAVFGRGSSALRASETVTNTQQGPLPNNQWQIESSSWFATSLAKLQRITVEYATGPDFLPEGFSVLQMNDSISQNMCRNQKVRDTGANTSFSVLGVALIIALGGLTILTNMILEPIVGWFQRRHKTNDHRRLQWILDEKLQLQRVAYEEAGIGQWQGLMDSVPVTARGEAFGQTAGAGGRIDARQGVQHSSESSSGKFESDQLLEQEIGSPSSDRRQNIDRQSYHPKST